MNEALQAILIQTLGYGVALVIGIGIITFLQRGFFFKFLKVKASLGRKVLVRLRQVTHWEYFVGRWEEQDLIIGRGKKKKRINNVEQQHIYRSIGIFWVDLDGKTYAVLPPNDTTAIEGFDPEKQESLITRALYKPPIEDKKNELIMVLVIAALIAAAASAYFGYTTLNKMDMVTAAIDGLKSGLVIPTG